MAPDGIRHVALNGREHLGNGTTEGDQDLDGHHRDEGQDQRVLNEGLTLLALETAKRGFSADNCFVNHCYFHLLPIRNLSKLIGGPDFRASRLFFHHFACQG